MLIDKLNKDEIKIIVRYIIFGGLTTFLNIFLFWIFTKLFGWQYLISNLIAIVISMLFAYVTNKIFVFNSRNLPKKKLAKEFIAFMSARIFSMVFDMASMFLLVSILLADELFSKIIVNIVVVIMNYLLSKLFIFKKV